MTDEELDRARAVEARRIFTGRPTAEVDGIGEIAARLAREGWMPPDPLETEMMAVNAFYDEQEGLSVDCRRRTFRFALERGIEIGKSRP